MLHQLCELAKGTTRTFFVAAHESVDGPTLPSPASDWKGSSRRMSCRTRQLSTTAESDPGCVKTLTLVGKVEFASQFQSNTKRAALAPSVMRSRQRKQFSINFVRARFHTAWTQSCRQMGRFFLLCSRAGQLPLLCKRKSMTPAFYFYSSDT